MDLSPKQIVNRLDKYIIGQDEAKRAVAIALRNRYRRAQLPKELREEITPKNIIMKGPTGVGKTEIARRLAKLVKAPFVKVEATKYTEVGYVGKDVEGMIRDLAECAYRLVKAEKEEEVKAKATAITEKRIVRALAEAKKDERGETPREMFEANILDGLRKGVYDNFVIEMEVADVAQPMELVRISKVLVQEIENHVATGAMIAGIHGHLAKVILHVGLDNGERTQSVPQVIQRKKTFRACTAGLIFQGNERTSQLDGIGQVFLQELFGEVEHVGSCQDGLAVFVKLHFITQEITIATQDFFGFRIPHYELLVGIGHYVVFVDVRRLARTSSACTEGNLTQASDFLHHIRRIMSRHDVDFIVTLVRKTQTSVRCQLGFQDFLAYRGYNIFHI